MHLSLFDAKIVLACLREVKDRNEHRNLLVAHLSQYIAEQESTVTADFGDALDAVEVHSGDKTLTVTFTNAEAKEMATALNGLYDISADEPLLAEHNLEFGNARLFIPDVKTLERLQKQLEEAVADNLANLEA